MKQLTEKISFQELGDERGNLVVIEEGKNVPFEVKRIYYIYNTQSGVARGFHAHHRLKQLLVAVCGSCEVILDNGKSRKTYVLDNPTEAIYLDGYLWREMHNFSEDCVLMCLASELYDEEDYIRDYDKFLAQVELR